jgi:hypothetical protein
VRKCLLATALLTVMASGSEPPGRETTYRAYCRHPSHASRAWFTTAYTSIAPALMFARKHNEANPGHDAAVAVIHGGEPAHLIGRR